MTTVIPRNMQLVAQRLANMERTTIRVRPQSNDAVRSGNTIHFRLPTNTLVDLHNLQFFGTCEIDKVTGTKPHGLPSNMQGAIERVDVVVNGQSVYGSNNDYGGIQALMEHYTTTEDSRRIADYLTSGDNKSRIKTVPAGSTRTDMRDILKNFIGSTQTGNEYSTDPYGNDESLPYRFPFLLKGLLGLLSGKYVRFVDTAVLGPVEIRLRLASPNVMWRGTEVYEANGISSKTASNLYNTASPPDFSFTEMYMYLDTIAFADDFYRLLLANRLAQGGIITIPFENYHSFQRTVNSSSDTVSFNLATQSLNMLVATLRDNGYNRRGAKKYSEYARNSNFYKFVSGDDNDYTKGPYNSKTRYQYQINNKPVPTWPVNVDEAHALTLAALDLNSDTSRIGHANMYYDYRDGQFAFIQNFSHHGETEKVISGLDTRGASSNMYFAVENLNTGNTSNSNGYMVTIWAVTTATLEISAGQNVTLIL